MKKILLLAILSFGLNTGVFADRIADLQKACELNEGRGCFNLGVMYELGEGLSKMMLKQ